MTVTTLRTVVLFPSPGKTFGGVDVGPDCRFVTSTTLLLVRHGETDWARERLHTGRSDVPLNARGEDQARKLAGALPIAQPAVVWVSPLQRAQQTARLAGLAVDRVDADLIEWDYGAADGRSTVEIREEVPGWDVWDHGVGVLGAGGETVEDVGLRADKVIERAKAVRGAVVLVAHAHLLRVLAARWIGMDPVGGRHFLLDPAGWAVLGWERESPVVERWNPSSR
ncbi:MAG: histidine phosphatase family protein [Aquihabitans sp.]